MEKRCPGGESLITHAMFAPLERGKCRACKTKDPATRWSDHSQTHCQGCYCANCGRKFLSTQEYHVDRRRGVKVCRGIGRCAERAAKLRPEKVA